MPSVKWSRDVDDQRFSIDNRSVERKAISVLTLLRQSFPLPVDGPTLTKEVGIGRRMRLTLVRWLIDEGFAVHSDRSYMATPPGTGMSRDDWISRSRSDISRRVLVTRASRSGHTPSGE